MSTLAYTHQLPWHDRWSQPTIEQMLEPLNPQHHKAVTSLMGRAGAYEYVVRSLVWYGAGWNWSVQFDLKDPKGNDLETLCYVVLKAETPLVCIPLPEATYNRLPIRRLHKYVRTELRRCKRTFDCYWATWNLSASSEMEQLTDLLKRKVKIALEPFKPTKAPKPKKQG